MNQISKITVQQQGRGFWLKKQKFYCTVCVKSLSRMLIKQKYLLKFDQLTEFQQYDTFFVKGPLQYAWSSVRRGH
jgi:hypothetical protein